MNIVEEVNTATAVDKDLNRSNETKVFVTKANSRRQKIFMVTLSSDNADALVAKGHLRIGWPVAEFALSL